MGTNFQIRCKLSSREHCIIACKNKQLLVHDLNSQHGTYINDFKIKTKKSIKLNNRDLLIIGSSIKKYFFIKQTLDLQVFDVINKVNFITYSKRSQEFWKKEKSKKIFRNIFKKKCIKAMKRTIFIEDLNTKIILSYNINFVAEESYLY